MLAYLGDFLSPLEYPEYSSVTFSPGGKNLFRVQSLIPADPLQRSAFDATWTRVLFFSLNIPHVLFPSRNWLTFRFDIFPSLGCLMVKALFVKGHSCFRDPSSFFG